MPPDDIPLRYTEIVNARAWKCFSQIFADELEVNGSSMSSTDYMTGIKDRLLVMSELRMAAPLVVAYDSTNGWVFARIATRATMRSPRNGFTALNTPFTYMRHTFFHVVNDKIDGVWDLEDGDAIKDQEELVEGWDTPFPDSTPRDAGSSNGASPSNDTTLQLSAGSTSLRNAFIDYIEAIKNPELMNSYHNTVLYGTVRVSLLVNGDLLQRAHYREELAKLPRAIPGVKITLRKHMLVVDEARQMVAARIEYSGTPTGSHMGYKPNGDNKVKFCEHAIYWFKKTQISKHLVKLMIDRVETIVDKEAYRKCLT
jgi:predicted ester cyclase